MSLINHRGKGNVMYGINSGTKRMRFKLLKSAAAIALGAALASTSMAELPPQVGTAKDSAHVFLNFSAGKDIPETPFTAAAYMNAIDPGRANLDFKTWLVEAGFISDVTQWFPTGQQTYTHQQPGDVGNDYGPGKINAFAHVIILNAADLGFIRNQYIRCKPDCKTPNAKVYTYLENYGSTQFDSAGHKQQNNPQAVTIALERRDGAPPTGRIADVAFEWSPAANLSNPTTNFGKLYAYVVQPQLSHIVCSGPGTTPTGVPNGKLDELYIWPSNGGANQAFWDCKFNTRSLTTSLLADTSLIGYLNPRPDHLVNSGDDFAPELDGLGTKQMPGVCLVCHGGNIPSNLATTGNWGATGQISEFKFLPADADNSIFGVDDTGAPLVTGAVASNMSRSATANGPGQELELRKYNQAVALTHGAKPPRNAVFLADGSIGGGNWQVPGNPTHALQVLFGWYQAFDGDYSMSGGFIPDPSLGPNNGKPILQNGQFTPVGWRSAAGTQLYQQVVKISCRSCHLNREPSLDFSTEMQFKAEKGNIQNYVFQPQCDYFKLHQVNPKNIVMPLARITWERFWNGIDPTTNLQNSLAATTSATDPNSQPNLLKKYFGYTPTSYCDAQH